MAKSSEAPTTVREKLRRERERAPKQYVRRETLTVLDDISHLLAIDEVRAKLPPKLVARLKRVMGKIRRSRRA